MNDPSSKPKSKLSPKDISLELGVSRGAVYDMVNAGLLPARKVTPRRLVVERADLERYLTSTAVVPKTKR